MRTPVVIQGAEVVVSASVGVAVTQGDGDPEQLLGDADLAMYRAKERRNGIYELFDESMRLRLAERLSIETALRAGLPRGEFFAHYQPIVALADGRWTGVEALARWRHPERGMVPPSEFIPVAEETGLIAPLGDWVLEEACTRLASWRDAYPDRAPGTVAVNVSVRQLEQDDFVAGIHALLDRLGFPPEQLLLEITESAMMRDEAMMVTRLADLRDVGVRLAIDDFGTGYSSLGRLSRLPVDTLKIDRSLVTEIDASPSGGALVSAAVAVAHSLGLRVVAEGIETPSQRAALEGLGCDEGQGFLLAHPLTADEVTAALADRSAASG
jgi:EAL domain-containing protein (putative c-di-GMP-specific phosphodiesterase class I)